MQGKILVYENRCKDLADFLKLRNCNVVVATQDTIAEELAKYDVTMAVLGTCPSQSPDPYYLVKTLRSINPRAFIFYIDEDDVNEEINALRAGADGFIGKPFDFEVLYERLRACSKRLPNVEQTNFDAGIYRIGAYEFEPEKRELRYISGSEHRLDRNGELVNDDVTQHLSDKETRLLLLLYDYRAERISRSFILNTIWREDTYYNGRSLDVFITKMRGYFKHDPNVKLDRQRGIGYRLIF